MRSKDVGGASIIGFHATIFPSRTIQTIFFQKEETGQRLTSIKIYTDRLLHYLVYCFAVFIAMSMDTSILVVFPN